MIALKASPGFGWQGLPVQGGWKSVLKVPQHNEVDSLKPEP